MKVKLLGFDDRGKVRLSMKVVDQATGEDITEKLKAEGVDVGSEETHSGPREHRGGGRGRSGGRDHHRRDEGSSDSKPEEPKSE